MQTFRHYRTVCGLLLVLLCPLSSLLEGSTFEQTWQRLTRPFLADLPVFTISLQAHGDTPAIPALNEPRVGDPASPSVAAIVSSQAAELLLSRTGTESWVLQLRSPWANAEIRRDATETLLVVTDHLIVFSGRDAADCTGLAAPSGALGRILNAETSLQGLPFLLSIGSLEALNRLPGCSGLFVPVTANTWSVGGQATLTASLGTNSATLKIEVQPNSKKLAALSCLTLTVREEALPLEPLPAGLHDQAVPRAELENMILRAVSRFCSVRFPSTGVLQQPTPASTTGGLIRPFDDHALLLLAGTPQQIGEAHGHLLGPAIRRMVDSTVYLVGLVTTVQSGKWFPAVLDEAFARLKPHIPSDYLDELEAIASGCPLVTPREIVLANIFPEYFHCSGFAVYGSATADGSLYHGRVLDYMTEIGLQQAAVTTIIEPAKKHAFVNVGYAGFVGSVTGMNVRGLSLGEMGGGGRGKWDGMPMTFMMRKALEDYSTVDEVVQFWQNTPRTCEYYYVVSQASPPAAVGLKATSEVVEILRAGEAHPQIGEGLTDTILMSAGSRLKEPRKRLEAGHGHFTVESALRLMDRPVSMRSNLHNALFAPARREVWIAHAGDGKPAAERRYVRYELGPLFEEVASLSLTTP